MNTNEMQALLSEPRFNNLNKDQVMDIVFDENPDLTPTEVREIMELLNEEPVISGATTATTPTTPPVRRQTADVEEDQGGGFSLGWVAAIVLLLAVAGLGYWIWDLKKDQQPPVAEAPTAAEIQLAELRKEIEEDKAEAAAIALETANKEMADKAIADAVAKALAENAPPEIGPVPAPVATTTTPVVVDLDFFGAEASGMSTDAKGLAVNKLRSTRHIDEIFEQQRANTVPTMHPKYRALMWKRGEINGENIAGTPVNLNVVAMEGRTEVSPEVLKQLRLKSGITDLEVRLLTADEFITNGLAKSHKFVNTEGHKWVVLYSPSRNFTTSS